MKIKILVPFGTMLQKPKGPHLPKISWRMIPKAYTSPLGDPLFWGLRNSSGARQNKSVEKIRFLHYLIQVSWIYRKKKVLKQNLSKHPLCLLYFPKNLFVCIQMMILITSVIRMLILLPVRFGAYFQQRKVGHLECPTTVYNTVRRLKIAVTS